MLYQITDFILQLLEGLIAGTCLLRLLFHFQNISLNPASGNTLGPFVFSVTNWMVLPLRRIIPSFGRLDTASLVGAYLIVLGKTVILWLLSAFAQPFTHVLLLSLFQLLQMGLSCLNGLVLVFAVMSWVNPQSPINYIFSRLVGPMLLPIQKIIPTLGGIDLSPLALLAVIQISTMILQSIEGHVIGLFI